MHLLPDINVAVKQMAWCGWWYLVLKKVIDLGNAIYWMVTVTPVMIHRGSLCHTLSFFELWGYFIHMGLTV